ncbi:hypothetical protein [Tenacibaculum sp. Bg11-29]|uniref:hypothetical protein n=1 Tax=Tenacibaculum sp. Bg11-29 TaxID=2058306 RepID=UPI0012FF0DE4|nr:hypothetical protein [Tenacibaculum sp. Bg11-29]
MLKNISNLGTSLNKSEQQSINGGNGRPLPCSNLPSRINGFCYLCGVLMDNNNC